MLGKEQKRIDELNIERLLKKTTVPVNLFSQQEAEVKALVKTYKIDIKGRTLPFRLKIN